eukprot:jgi/Mesvir1/24135/Mv10852-RA.1
MGFQRIVASRRKVFNGTAVRTKGGLTAKDLTKNNSGDIVSIKKRQMGQKYFHNVQPWTKFVMKVWLKNKGTEVYDRVKNVRRQYTYRDAMLDASRMKGRLRAA